MRDIDDDSVAITGASSGIGAATARTLAAAGVDLALGARREDRLADLAAELRDEHGVAVEAIAVDVTERERVEAFVEAAAEAFDGLDGVVVNAGIGLDGDLDSMSIDDYRTMMGVNVDGAFHTARAALPHLRESDGTIVFVASFAGEYPRPTNPVYAASKWWVRGFAHSLEGSVGPDGVAVSVVNPTEVRTEFGSEQGESFEEQFDSADVTDPDAIADGIRFCLSQEGTDTVSELDLYRRDKFAGW
ncbi:SDR family NAD(P)-dependent oxidoreductase [Halobaculum sp. WSA2]|uniref:SDR family NAD(P)-dependent oxidoreductase n=1 Tax=Halobaculum saliterrae TaxID=2073113 RepID=A0A6B0SW80_9EURY|nr:SDR family oxidoreductase [Halobaculum saliterrae]MXR43298.1 SDR family NAD(P)-dependent oxidoreductase [Halobaculum saliterrae]